MPDFTPAYLIYSMPYRDTSLLVRLYTRDYGKVSAVARGVRRPNHPWRLALTAFTPLSIRLGLPQQPESLARLYEVEQHGTRYYDNYWVMLCLFYINELMAFLVPFGQADEALYRYYEWALDHICAANKNYVLRCFEYHLLGSLGYALHFDCDARHAPLDADTVYTLPALGLPVAQAATTAADARRTFDGRTLKHLNRAPQPEDPPEILKVYRVILGRSIDALLEGRHLASRRLARDYARLHTQQQ